MTLVLNFLLYQFVFMLHIHHTNARYSVMINGSTSPQFISTSGVKQGCSMSPILSNLFQNDIHDIFNDTDCDLVKLHETHLYNISLADVLLLLSCSREGLQKFLDNLSDYCEKWGLLVNEKTWFSPSLSGRQKNSITEIQRLNVWNISNILVSTYPTILTSK